ncbi:hypothetical protein [Georgenia sp. H159]|uniref:hypothetical protein n=1 Tax=Georgenia sp. H159 TaxID=3076115 RepID=UPI002D783896|nr:hypothetical protein [Georgenia sp. H159]
MGDVERSDKGIEVVGAALGAAVGAALGGPVGAVIGAGATPPLTDLVGKAWDELRGRRENNAIQVVEKAAYRTEISVEQLLATALADPNLSRLLHGALQAAGASLDQEKVEALARCLANGVEDVARVDGEALVVRALSDLDPVHIRVLAKLERTAMQPRDIHRFICGDIDAREFLLAEDLSGPVLAVLERHGLAESHQEIKNRRGSAYTRDRAPEVETRFECTEFGRMCLRRLGHGTRPSRREFLSDVEAAGDSP